MTSRREIEVFKDLEEVSRRAAEEFRRQAEAAVEARGLFTAVLSGGETPKRLYSLLAEERLPWDKVHFFWSDERHVPPDDPQSNYRMARETLLSRIQIPRKNVHRILAEYPNAQSAADDYEAELRGFFQLGEGEPPRFDFILLGMGPDGHTASLFPGTEVLAERKRLVAANWVPKFNARRITLTFPAINHAACVVFLVSGDGKAGTLKAVLEGEEKPEELPAQSVRPADGRLLWLVDEPAARLLRR